MAMPGVKTTIVDKTHPKKHLVLGSEGQIGKYVCDEIERNHDEVIRWDVVLSEGQDLRLTWSGPFMGPLTRAVQEADFVHFLAYDVGGSSYLAKNQNQLQYIQNNMLIMNNVFSVLDYTKKPFYFASSQMSNMTDSVYGQLKAIGESYTRALGGVNIQFWNVYGYESNPDKTHVITDFIKMALTDGRILCRTNGKEERHFTHARDAADLLYRITQHYNELTPYQGRPFPLAKTWNAWATIDRVAQMIAGNITGTELFFGTKEDKTQTKVNPIDPFMHSELMKVLYPLKAVQPTTWNTTFGFQEADPFKQLAQPTSTNTFAVANMTTNNPGVISLEAGIKDMIERIKAEG